MERTAEQNLELRCALHADGSHDGLLAFVGATPVGWAQLGRRDRLPKLVSQLDLEPDPGAWAVTCLLVAPAHRRTGIGPPSSTRRSGPRGEAGARASRATPAPRRSTTTATPGPARRALFAAAGFSVVRDGRRVRSWRSGRSASSRHAPKSAPDRDDLVALRTWGPSPRVGRSHRDERRPPCTPRSVGTPTRPWRRAREHGRTRCGPSSPTSRASGLLPRRAHQGGTVTVTVCDDEAGDDRVDAGGGPGCARTCRTSRCGRPNVSAGPVVLTGLSAPRAGCGRPTATIAPMADAPVTSPAEQIAELGARLAWVRDYL